MHRERLVGNIVEHLKNAPKRIRMRQTAIFFKADADYGRRVAEGLGLMMAKVERLAGRFQGERAAATGPRVPWREAA
jgi:catalase